MAAPTAATATTATIAIDTFLDSVMTGYDEDRLNTFVRRNGIPLRSETLWNDAPSEGNPTSGSCHRIVDNMQDRHTGETPYAVGRKTVERELGKSSSKKESKEDSQQ